MNFSSILTWFFPKRMLGIDIGTSSVKVVELSRWGGGRSLENYGEIKSSSFFKGSIENLERGSNLFSTEIVAKAVKGILEEAKIKTRVVIFSIPDFSSFFVSFDLPPMAEREIPDAIRFNAPQYIPLPLSETTLDWKIIAGAPGGQTKIKVLVVAVANQVIQEYQRIAQLAGLELYALEAEAFSLTRALTKNVKKNICLVDIGSQSTTINIIEKGVLNKSYSLDFSGSQLTYSISSSLGVGYAEAEQIKHSKGLLATDKNASGILYVLIDPLIAEIKKIMNEFDQIEGKKIEGIYLTGGTANLPGFKDYFAQSLEIPVEVPNCFENILHPSILSPALKEMSPRFSIATGAALAGLE